ncbi:transcriptional repressor LexA [uncultured Lamprocystis sp.]|jgi:repressor LexA|uniref:transcriptional repressor LexA n=1 Tax=uncultured Lamprocystis sp. TaxID=543132 RepID=UPI0025EDD5B0|nr:transcriptional repressor LexA [uncultured Lamprocystis sp.]
MPLTLRQQQVLDCLRQYAADFAQAPTLDVLCRRLGLRSRGSLHKHVQALIAEGLVEPLNGRHRGIHLVTQSTDENTLPLLGKIAAGRPIEALPQPDTIEVPPRLRTSRPCYVLQVTGDSMAEAGILDGDFVVIEQRETARNGEIVVALIRAEETTLKRIIQEPGRVTLIPANRGLLPVVYAPEEVAIQGVLVGQMRTYH